MILALAALAGGLGAVSRFLLDRLLRFRRSPSFPWPTAVINISGSFALGVVAGLAGSALPTAVATVVGVGFLGGYTTFSTASVETVVLARSGKWGRAMVYSLGMLVAATLAAGSGLLLAVLSSSSS